MAVWLMKKNSVIELATNRTYIGLVAFSKRQKERSEDGRQVRSNLPMTNSTFICKFKYHLTLLKRTWLNSLNYWKRHLKYFPNRNNLLLASFPLFSIVMSVQWLVYYFYWICMCVHSDWFKSVCVVILYCLYVRRELIRTPCLYNAWDSQREIKIDLSLVVGV